MNRSRTRRSAAPRGLIALLLAIPITFLAAGPERVAAQQRGGAERPAEETSGEETPADEAPMDEGQRISEYDFAVSHAMRTLMETGAEPRRVALYVARKEGERWHVYFGSFDLRGPLFGIAYEVVQAEPGSAEFEVRRYAEDRPADAELTRAAMALVTALDAFEPRSVRFYTYVWRDEAGRWVTYFVPEQVAPGAVRRAADQRVVVSADARRVLESRFGAADREHLWTRATPPPERPTARDLVHILLSPQLAPFALLTRRLVCEMNWEGEIDRCLIGSAR